MMARLFAALCFRHTEPPVAPQPAAQPFAEPPPRAGDPPPPDTSDMRRLGRESLHAAMALGETLQAQPSHSAWGQQVAEEIRQKLETWNNKAQQLAQAGHAAADKGDLDTAQKKIAELDALANEVSDYIPQTNALGTTAVSRLFQHQLAGESAAHLSRQLGLFRYDTQAPPSNEQSELALTIQDFLHRHPHGAPVKNWQRELMRRHWDAALFCGDSTRRTLFDACAAIVSMSSPLWHRAGRNDVFLAAVHETYFPPGADLHDWDD